MKVSQVNNLKENVKVKKRQKEIFINLFQVF